MKRLVGCLLATVLAVSAQTKEVEVQASQTWVDTGLDVKAGDLLRFESSGTSEVLRCGASGLTGGNSPWLARPAAGSCH